MAVLEARAANSKISRVVETTSENAADISLPGWKRAAVTFEIPGAQTQDDGDGDDEEAEDFNPAGNYRVKFSAKVSDAEVLVDSVQITEGEKLQQFVLHQGLEANFISPETQAIYQLGEPGNMTFNLALDQGVAARKVTYQVTDYFDQVVVKPTVLILSSNGSVPVALPTDRAGFFRVRTEIASQQSGSEHTLTREFLYNVVHPSAPRTGRMTRSLLGGYFTNAPIGQFSYAEVAHRFGIYEFNTLGHQMGRWKANMARDPKDGKKYLRGQYDFRHSDKELELFTRNNINVIVNFHVNSSSSSYGSPFEYTEQDGLYFEFKKFEFKKNDKFSQKDWLD